MRILIADNNGNVLSSIDTNDYKDTVFDGETLPWSIDDVIADVSQDIRIMWDRLKIKDSK